MSVFIANLEINSLHYQYLSLKYFSNPVTIDIIHTCLAHFFSSIAINKSIYHFLKAHKLSNAISLLTNLQFLSIILTSNQHHDLLDLYRFALESLNTANLHLEMLNKPKMDSSLLLDFQLFISNKFSLLTTNPQYIIQYANNEPSISRVSQLAKDLNEPCLEWLNKPSSSIAYLEFDTWDDVESIDVNESCIITSSKKIINGLIEEPQETLLKLFDLQSNEIANFKLPVEGKLSLVLFSSINKLIAYTDGLTLRFFNSKLQSISEPLQCNSRIDYIPSSELTVGVLKTVWFNDDLKFATVVGIYNELESNTQNLEIIIWDSINHCILYSIEYTDLIPISISPRSICFRSSLNSNLESMYFNLETNEFVDGIYPSLFLNLLNEYNLEDVDLIDLSLFWPNVKSDYNFYPESLLFKILSIQTSVYLCKKFPRAVIWDPLSGLYVIEFTSSITILGKFSLSEIAIITQRNVPLIGSIDSFMLDWKITISDDGSLLALSIDDNKVNVYKIVNSTYCLIQTVDGYGPLMFTCDNLYLITSYPIRKRFISRNKLEYRPTLQLVDFKFLINQEIIVLDYNGIVSVVDTFISRIIYQDNATGKYNETVISLSTHPKRLVFAVATINSRIHLSEYASSFKYIQYTNAFNSRIIYVVFSPSHQIEFSVFYETGEISVFKDFQGLQCIDFFGKRYLERKIISRLKYSNEGNLMACFTSDGTLYLRNNLFKNVKTIQIYDNNIDVYQDECKVCLSFQNESEDYIAISKFNVISIINVKTLKIDHVDLHDDIIDLSFHNNLIVACHSFRIDLWDFQSKSRIYSFTIDFIQLGNSLKFEFIENLVLVKSMDVESQLNIVRIPVLKDVEMDLVVDDWRELTSKQFNPDLKLLKGIIQHRDLPLLKLIVNVMEFQSTPIAVETLTNLLESCFFYIDVSSFSNQGILLDSWIPGLDYLFETGIDLASKFATRALIFAYGLDSKYAISLFKQNMTSNFVSIIHDIVIESLDYESLPKGLIIFLRNIIDSTGLFGVDAIRLNDDQVICKASLLGKLDVVRFCISEGSDFRAQQDTPMLNALAIENKEIVDFLKGKGVTVNVKVEHINSWIINHLKYSCSNASISRIKILLSQVFGTTGKRALVFNDCEIFRFMVKNTYLSDVLSLVSVSKVDIKPFANELMLEALKGICFSFKVKTLLHFSNGLKNLKWIYCTSL